MHHRRSHLPVALATAVVTAVLTGALLIGDSVRGSLKDLALTRLGKVELALESPRFVRAELAADLAASEGFEDTWLPPAGAIRLAGTAVHANSGSQASRVHVHGVDTRFGNLMETPFPVPERKSGSLPGAVINEALARELGAGPGDDLLLSFPRSAAVPRDTLLGRRAPEEVTASLRVTLTAVVPDQGPGGFSLTPHQGAPHNLFLSLEALQRRLGQEGKINTLFLGRPAHVEVPLQAATSQAESMLRQVLALQDLDLSLQRRDGVAVLESASFVLPPQVAEAVMDVAQRQGMAYRAVQIYLANSIRLQERLVPYSTVAAVGGPARNLPFKPMRLQTGQPAPMPGEDEVLLGQWAADDLGARIGDTVAVDYFHVGDDETLRPMSASFTVAGILAPAGLALDPGLTPEYPGIADAEHITEWDPPFPVDLSRVRAKDEAYWDRHRGAPKAFFAPHTASRLWGSRHGHLTSIRLPDPGRGFEETLLARLELQPFGLSFRDVRHEALEAAAGTTDFSQLFLAFSFFLIASAVMLVALLFSLAVEQRSGEVGLLLALGFTPAQVSRRFLLENLPVAVVGVTAGTALGVAYGAALMAGLRSIWRPAIGSSQLFLHVHGPSLVTGAGVALGVTLAAVGWRLARLCRRPVTALLAGVTPRPVRSMRRRAGIWPAVLCLVLAVVLILAAVLTGRTASPGLAFASGAALLASGLLAFAHWCRRSRRPQEAGRLSLPGMAARNSSWRPSRSILSLALVASASFVIVTVAANRHEPDPDRHALPPGSGGFRLVAEARIPIHQNLAREEGRFELGLTAPTTDILARTAVASLRLRPGSDASCLNLYAPGVPRLLGVPGDFRGQSAFAVQASVDGGENIWDLLRRPLEPGVVPAVGDANSVRWILHLGLGEDLVVENDAGESIRLRIVGLLQRSIFQSELLIAEEAFLRHFPAQGGYGYFLFKPPVEESPQLVSALERDLKRFGMDVEETSARLAQFAAVENTYLSTFQTLGGFGLLLGTVGLGLVLLRNVLERRGELATLRAFGFRRRRLGRMVLMETGFLLVAGVLLGSLAAVAAVLPRLVAGELHLPWLALARTLGLVLLVGMVSGLAAVRRVARTPLLPVLKSER